MRSAAHYVPRPGTGCAIPTCRMTWRLRDHTISLTRGVARAQPFPACSGCDRRCCKTSQPIDPRQSMASASKAGAGTEGDATHFRMQSLESLETSVRCPSKPAPCTTMGSSPVAMARALKWTGSGVSVGDMPQCIYGQL